MVEAHVAYSCKRLNTSTFLVVHDDKYAEHPFIYVKLYNEPQLVVLFDTGCGADAAAQETASFTNLRSFIEEHPVAENNHKPLNPGGKREYLVICTHCHFDHIGGIESFPPAVAAIFASGNDRTFLDRANLSSSSLCEYVGMRTPLYTISHFVEDGEWLFYGDISLKLQALYTPGHTPDSLTIYDDNERWMFTGDLFYRRSCILPNGSRFDQPIIFPPQGDWFVFMSTLDRLSSFVDNINGTSTESVNRMPVRIACSHTTENAPASTILNAVILHFNDIIQGRIAARNQTERNGEIFALWEDVDEPEFSVLAPKRLRDEYRQRPPREEWTSQ